MSSSAEAAGAVSAVIVAGGAGRRVGGAAPKQYRLVGGRPVLLRAVQAFLDHAAVGSVVVVLPPADAADPPAWLRELPVRIVAGGAERSDSVWNGLRATPADASIVLIHDAARPFVPSAVIDRVLEAATSGPVIAALPVADTIKEVDAQHRIVGSPDRSRLWRAQTPQAFPRSLILAAHQRARDEGVAATDDAMLVERLGVPVGVVEGAAENIKLTHAVDLLFAEALAARAQPG